MNRRLAAAALAIVAIGFCWFALKQSAVPLETKKVVLPSAVRSRSSDEQVDPVAADEAGKAKIFSEWSALLTWLHGDPAPDADAVRERLLALRTRWAAMDATVLADALGDLLDRGEDLPLAMEFQVGLHGFLDGWPTLRVFLLDVLVASDQEVAGGVARKILDQTASAEEYAMALRTLTKKGPGKADSVELLQRFDRMLGEPGWQKSPGFAEALDVARLIGSPEAARHLLAWSGEAELKRMAMEEFAAVHPAAMVEALSAADSLDGVTRADLMARVDPRDPVQRATVDAYFRNQDLSQQEATAFLRAYPLRSTTTGHRLYGEPPSPFSREEIAAGDRIALGQVDQWLADPSLERNRTELTALRTRLAKWVEQAR